MIILGGSFMKKLLYTGLAVMLFSGSMVAGNRIISALEQQLQDNLTAFYTRGGQMAEKALELAQASAEKMIKFFKKPQELQINDTQVCIVLEAVKYSYIKDIIINILKIDFANLALDGNEYFVIADRVAHRLLDEYYGPATSDSTPADSLVCDYDTLKEHITIVLIGYLQEYK